MQPRSGFVLSYAYVHGESSTILTGSQNDPFLLALRRTCKIKKAFCDANQHGRLSSSTLRSVSRAHLSLFLDTVLCRVFLDFVPRFAYYIFSIVERRRPLNIIKYCHNIIYNFYYFNIIIN